MGIYQFPNGHKALDHPELLALLPQWIKTHSENVTQYRKMNTKYQQQWHTFSWKKISSCMHFTMQGPRVVCSRRLHFHKTTQIKIKRHCSLIYRMSKSHTTKHKIQTRSYFPGFLLFSIIMSWATINWVYLLHFLWCAFIYDVLDLQGINMGEDWLVDASEWPLSWFWDLGDKRLWVWVFIVVQMLSKFLQKQRDTFFKINHYQLPVSKP